jgi:hypothetical protein
MSASPGDASGAALDELVRTLDGARDLLRDYEPGSASRVSGDDDGDLLQQCLDMCTATEQGQEPVRTLHHLACSGGTLLSKCIASMPGVQLLSEIDPLSPLAGGPKPATRFAPSDIALRLRQGTRAVKQEALVALFQAEIRTVHDAMCRVGQRLVIRDHAHSHFTYGPGVACRPTLREMIAAVSPVRSVVTVRNPFDSFTSLRRNGWIHFEPGDFGSYCDRYHAMLDAYADVPVVRYEDLLSDPQATMARLCQLLDVPFSRRFVTTFSAFEMTGDSGRSGAELAARPRAPESVELEAAWRANSSLRSLLDRLGYP